MNQIISLGNKEVTYQDLKESKYTEFPKIYRKSVLHLLKYTQYICIFIMHCIDIHLEM